MKAKEYFDKYFESAKSFEEIAENGKALFGDLLDEYSQLRIARNVKTADGLVGIIRELNDKWNSVASRVEHKFSVPVLKRNVIWNTLLSEKLGNIYPRKPD